MAYAWLDQLVADGAERLHTAAGLSGMLYLHSRGVSVAEARLHKVGWFDPTYRIATCAESFVEWQKGYLRQRLVFPVTSTLNEVVGLQSRNLADKRYQIYYAGSRDIYPPVFGLGQAAPAMYDREQVVVVEGVFDYFAVRAAGVDNVVALLRAHAGGPTLKLLSRYVKRVIALLDMDQTGRDAIGALLRAGTFEVVAPVYGAHDPADLVKLPGGYEQLARLVAPAKDRYTLWG